MTLGAESNAGGLQVLNLVKRYGDTVALSGLTVAAMPGEILGVAGPNGAGKSTLVKILAGETTPDSGTIELKGDLWSAAADYHRVAVVHQDPQLFPNLTVAENLLVGVEPSRLFRPSRKDVDREVLAEVGLLPYIDVPVGELSLAMQQRTEIARALSMRADVFLFDEPNSALTESESAELFERMHILADQGRIVFLVTHRLGELAAHCDRAVVIVDGAVKTSLAGGELSEERIARELVVGRRMIDDSTRRRGSDKRPTLLETSGWTHGHRMFADADLAVAAGEIFAIVGVEGSGGRELVRSIAGFEKAAGSISVTDQHGSSAQQRVAYVIGDRSQSLFDNLSVGENLILRQAASLTSRLGVLDRRRARASAQRYRSDFSVKTASLDTPIRSLSGGNQQKVAIAAALATRPSVMALEEPTRGVDLGSRADIYRLLREFVESDAAVILYCTEDSEVFDAADRVAVMVKGRIAGVLTVADYGDAEELAGAIALLGGTDITHASSPQPKG